MKTFRNNHPQRTYTGTQKAHYRDYKDELRKDFHGRCGYTDCLDIWWGDGFNVDHFAPRKPKVINPIKLAKFTAKEHIYSNLVYACPQVNRAKSNDWASDDPDTFAAEDKGYLDPCTFDFNDYFERTDSGGIIPKDNPIARYMWAKLKLYLKRYELYWRLEQIIDRLERLTNMRSRLTLPAGIETELLRGIADLTQEHIKYLKYLQVNYPEIIR
jgi:hypothetical protein